MTAFSQGPLIIFRFRFTFMHHILAVTVLLPLSVSHKHSDYNVSYYFKGLIEKKTFVLFLGSMLQLINLFLTPRTADLLFAVKFAGQTS